MTAISFLRCARARAKVPETTNSAIPPAIPAMVPKIATTVSRPASRGSPGSANAASLLSRTSNCGPSSASSRDLRAESEVSDSAVMTIALSEVRRAGHPPRSRVRKEHSGLVAVLVHGRAADANNLSLNLRTFPATTMRSPTEAPTRESTTTSSSAWGGSPAVSLYGVRAAADQEWPAAWSAPESWNARPGPIEQAQRKRAVGARLLDAVGRSSHGESLGVHRRRGNDLLECIRGDAHRWVGSDHEVGRSQTAGPGVLKRAGHEETACVRKGDRKEDGEEGPGQRSGASAQGLKRNPEHLSHPDSRGVLQPHRRSGHALFPQPAHLPGTRLGPPTLLRPDRA